MNLPNRLTMLRVLLIPAFMITFLSGGVPGWIPLVIFVAAGITDALDGYIARKYDLVTDFGKLMDPLADKLLCAAALICFTAVGAMHPAVTVVVIARELFITGMRSVAASEGKVLAADIWGKLKTVSQDITVGWFLLWNAVNGFGDGIMKTVGIVLITVMLLLTVISAVNYVIKNKEVFHNI